MNALASSLRARITVQSRSTNLSIFPLRYRTLTTPAIKTADDGTLWLTFQGRAPTTKGNWSKISSLCRSNRPSRGTPSEPVPIPGSKDSIAYPTDRTRKWGADLRGMDTTARRSPRGYALTRKNEIMTRGQEQVV